MTDIKQYGWEPGFSIGEGGDREETSRKIRQSSAFSSLGGASKASACVVSKVWRDESPEKQSDLSDATQLAGRAV